VPPFTVQGWNLILLHVLSLVNCIASSCFHTEILFFPQICSRIAAQRAANPNLDKLHIKKDSSYAEPVDQLFVDTAVYSRNRCFRLAFSSKSGKKSFLRATGRFKCKNMVSSS
jgi:hypothetical protein